MTDGGPGAVLVTGAGRGLGLELCRLYLARDWTVFPLVRDEAAAARWRASTAERCHPVVADLRDDGAVETVRTAVAGTDRLSLLINSAGVPGGPAVLACVDPREVAELVETHCCGVLRCTQAVLPLLRAAGDAKVINVTSRTGSLARNARGEFDPESVSYSYRIAKAAQNMLTVCMSRELRREGIVMCALHPGEFRTALNPDAERTPADAARRVTSFVERLRPADHGGWFDADSGVVPW